VRVTAPSLSWHGAVFLFAALVAPAGASVPRELPGAPAFHPQLHARLASVLAAQGDDYVPRTRHRDASGSPLFTNRLILETSPYLQQHAHNPVNWYPWGDEAFQTARRLDRPVLVSIGYSTCHWCHVMEEESFDDPEIATLLNQHFVAIKVDRETRPDIDSIYMLSARLIEGGGGWPLNVWVTPDREPFHAGTYFPPRDGRGRPAFRTVLEAILEAWATQRGALERTAARVGRAVRREVGSTRADASATLDPAPLRRAYQATAQAFDPTWGGVGRGQKFPASLPVRFLLRYFRRTGDPRALEMATLTLEKMAMGGIHDQVGGGFHRYATDRRWLVPHFEKMLYDNALRVVEYLEAWQITGRPDFADAARRTLEYVAADMTTPRGAFVSATDADSRRPDGEMEEGFYFTWTPAELRAALAPEDAAAAIAFWGVTETGNLDGRTVLHSWRDAKIVAAELEIEEAVLRDRLERARGRLAAARDERPRPLRDEKVLVAWNGLMISAFARAGFAWQEPRWTRTAARAADFLLEHLWVEGRLLRVHQDGRSGGPSFLEDHAFLIAGLLDLYEADADPRWLESARAIQAALDAHYWDPEGGAYYRTADDGERLLGREKPAHDGALPSGNSVQALNLLRLAELTADDDYSVRAEMLLSAFASALHRNPSGIAELLLAVDMQLDTPKEIVVVRPAGSEAGIDALLAPLRASFVPNRVLVVAAEGENLDAQVAQVPLLRGKKAQGGRATAYVCENRVCSAPTSDPATFARQIRKVRPLD